MLFSLVSHLLILDFPVFLSCFLVRFSDTTRSPRPGEENGIAYHFVTREQDLVKKVSVLSALT